MIGLGRNAAYDAAKAGKIPVLEFGSLKIVPRVDGIGFMLRGTSLTSVDLDHCLDQQGRPSAWAETWLETMHGAYVERTPSGEGLRIIGVGGGERLQRRWTIKDAPHPEAAIEIYRTCER
jgi:primase-polymerase (primpol)-like protein